MSNNIGYHTRLYGTHKDTKKSGGSFGGFFDIETANRLVNSNFTVIIKPSGFAVFVDKDGSEVSLYFTVDASKTEMGKQALKQFHKDREIAERAQKIKYREEQELIERLMEQLSHDEIIKRLSKV